MTVEVLPRALPAAEAAAIDRDGLASIARELLAAERGADGASLTVLLAGDELLRELNREHRGVDAPTDVLSFPAEGGEPFPAVGDAVGDAGGDAGENEAEPPYLGDIAVSVEAARRQAAEAGIGPELELRHLVLHGLLHLLGHDHKTPEQAAAMEAREEALLGPEIHAGGRGDRDG